MITAKVSNYFMMRKMTSTMAVAACGLSAILALGAHAATFNLRPSADAFVTTGPSGNLGGYNYGAAGALSVAAAGLAKGEFQSLLRFDLSAARASFDAQFGAGQWSIQSVTLQLNATAPNNAIFNASAAGQFGISLMQNDSWIEGVGTPANPATTGLTFSSLPSFTGAADESLGNFSFNGATSGAANYALELTSGLAADVSAGGLASFHLTAADSAVSYLFDSGNFNSVSSRPVLAIVVAPEPGLISLLTVGTILLCAPKRGHRKPPA